MDMTKLKWILIGVVVILALAVGGFVIWGSTPLPAMPEALATLQSDAQVKVESGAWYVFRPTDSEPATGFIFYPGGRVDPRAYAPAARAIAAQGYLVVITPMPLNLAIFGIEKASDVIQAFPAIKRWAIGGHSLGGSMAASYVNRHPQAIQGLVLWASYPADSDSLAGRSLMVVSIYGTRDGQLDKLEKSGALLPSNTTWVKIDGGNHAQFGWYGVQPGDGQATISRAAQQSQIVAATAQLLKEIQAK
jgi:hypothetical protein